MDDNYIPVDKDNLPEPGDIVASIEYIENSNSYKSGFIIEIIDYSQIDEKTNNYTYVTKLLCEPYEISKNLRIDDSYFTDWYIIKDKSVRNKSIIKLIND